jgi:hypothetical protein
LELGALDAASGTLQVLYNFGSDVAGFQFDVSGLALTGGSGGDAGDAGFTVSVGSTTVLGISFTGDVVPAGSGVLTELSFSSVTGDVTALSLGNNGAVSTLEGTALSLALVGDDITHDQDCAGTYYGDLVDDCAGECGGSASDLGCGCGEAAPSGCDETCGSTAVEDCAGVCDGNAELDDCGVCDGDGDSCTGQNYPDWDSDGDGLLDNYLEFQNNCSITSITLIDEEQASSEHDLIAAFINGEQRGVARATSIPDDLGGGYSFLMLVFSNQKLYPPPKSSGIEVALATPLCSPFINAAIKSCSLLACSSSIKVIDVIEQLF